MIDLPGLIDLEKTKFILTLWPDNRWPVEMSLWIEQLMRGRTPPESYREAIKKKNIVCARNTAIRDCALKSPPVFEWFVFLDRDVRPDHRTTKFLTLDADVKCCQVEQSTKTAYSWPHDFHESIWCTSRNVLESIQPPWFMQAYSADGCEMEGCICVSFAKKVREAGFSIAHGGWAEHDRDQSWC